VIVTTDDEQHTLMNELVLPDHLRDEHSASQIVERLVWAVNDASTEDAPVNGTQARTPASARRRDGVPPALHRV